MAVDIYSYPACSTCKKAEKWLEAQEVPFTKHHIVESPPSAEEIKKLHHISGYPIQKFFNTSGKKYREMGLKDKVKEADNEELYDILASDGMLIKRPIVTDGSQVTLGFKEALFEETWKQ
ncbi:arsenate reductase family protein [Sinobaca sp. H24]|uniref:arsenate reductase family protein n=1 Tax=Sinobaca sp. H24 TaxID=2923376 RepID=UPI00207993EA|nr:arsenate reductase family protein [Sinobaca sp. H24]